VVFFFVRCCKFLWNKILRKIYLIEALSTCRIHTVELQDTYISKAS